MTTSICAASLILRLKPVSRCNEYWQLACSAYKHGIKVVYTVVTVLVREDATALTSASMRIIL